MEEDFHSDRNFLKKTELVVSFTGRQVKVANADSLWQILENMSGLDIFKESPTKRKLLSLNNKIALLKMQFKQNKITREAFEESVGKIHSEIDLIPLAALEIEDALNIEMIFPTIAMPIIQRLKHHPEVNQEKTCKCMACIRVYLF